MHIKKKVLDGISHAFIINYGANNKVNNNNHLFLIKSQDVTLIFIIIFYHIIKLNKKQ